MLKKMSCKSLPSCLDFLHCCSLFNACSFSFNLLAGYTVAQLWCQDAYIAAAAIASESGLNPSNHKGTVGSGNASQILRFSCPAPSFTVPLGGNEALQYHLSANRYRRVSFNCSPSDFCIALHELKQTTGNCHFNRTNTQKSMVQWSLH